MGAVYDIEGLLKFRSSQDIVDITRKFVAQSDDRIRFGDDADFTDLEGALICIFTKRGLRISNETETSVEFDSSFDASYGWEGVMMDWFESVAPVLDDGSELKIWPDSGLDDGIVKGGKVTWGGYDESVTPITGKITLSESDDIIDVGNIKLPLDTTEYGYASYDDIKRDTQKKINDKALKAGNMTLKEYAINYCYGYLDEDVCDKDVDMLVACIWDEDMANSSDPYDQFIDLLVSQVKVVGKGAYGPICDFSGWARQHLDEVRSVLKKNYYETEFDFDTEAEYAFVYPVLENLISGNAYESEYKNWIKVFGK